MSSRYLFGPLALLALVAAPACVPTPYVPPPVTPASSLAPSPAISSNWIYGTPAPVPKVQTPYEADGLGNHLGVVSTWEVVAGLRRFKASHEGQSNFVVWLRARGGTTPSVILAFNRIGRGSWTYSQAIEETGDYSVEVTAGGPWSVSVE